MEHTPSCLVKESDKESGQSTPKHSDKSYEQVNRLIESSYCLLGNKVKLTRAVWSANQNSLSCYAINDDRLLIGYLGVALFEVSYGTILSSVKNLKFAYINYLCVDSNSRRQGLARSMIAKLMTDQDTIGYYLSETSTDVFLREQLGPTKVFSYSKPNWFRPVQAKRAQQLGYIWDLPRIISLRSTKGITSLDGYYRVNKDLKTTIVKLSNVNKALHSYLSIWNSNYMVYLSIEGLNNMCKHFEVYLVSYDGKPIGLVAGHTTPVRIGDGSWFNNFYIVYMLGQAEVTINALMAHLTNIVCLYMLEGGPLTTDIMEKVKACPTTNLSHLTVVRMDKIAKDKINLPVF